MKSATASFVPIALAVVAVGGLGWFVKRQQNAPEPKPHAFKIEVRQTGSGAGPPPEKVGDLKNPPAAWIRYESVEDGKKREPSKSHFRLAFTALDEANQEWPLKLAASGTRGYLLVPGGLPRTPKKLRVECTYVKDKLASWEIPALSKSKRRLDARQAVRPAGQLAGWSLAPNYAIQGKAAILSVSALPNGKKDPAENVTVTTIGHSFGVRESEQNYTTLNLPLSCLSAIEAVDVRVARTRSMLKKVGVEVQVRAKREAGQIRLLPEPKEIDLGNGCVLQLRPTGLATGTAKEFNDGSFDKRALDGYAVTFSNQPKTSCWLHAVSSTGLKAELSFAQRGAPLFIGLFAPEQLREIQPFKLVLQYYEMKTLEQKDLILAFDASKIVPTPSLGGGGAAGFPGR